MHSGLKGGHSEKFNFVIELIDMQAFNLYTFPYLINTRDVAALAGASRGEGDLRLLDCPGFF